MAGMLASCSLNLLCSTTVGKAGAKQRSPRSETPHRTVCVANNGKKAMLPSQIEPKEQKRPGVSGLAAALAVCAAMAGPVSAGEVYEGMYSMDQKFTETADVGVSMNTAQTKINKVVDFLSACAADSACNTDLASLRDDMQSAVRNTQVAIRSAGKNAEYDAQAAKLIFIADEFDCIEIRRDKSTAFLVNQFGAQKVGAGVLGADHVKGRKLCSAEADALFGKGPKTSVLAKEGLPTISEAAEIINTLKATL
mmetsp:Transcript_26443/g.44290  ORF Transcript_26443/g.44290 Transcript_26443/m.44290 type:complete len:252 (-) Transcript_26443:43-798(-)|eukprot:CAMPEP_0198206360 /NCGR_PEP_ID=MMETSP1445-20131203/9890_1 /TAXON_ID=36898 /ORGANISM="Pyramimonas sp., Strain CCMP2087" /LENGTH=251 /DNA_ID=CAMNT_0043879021 /DNA_START=84 /DNA_END=839 /DNA_ORIENTATION=-